METNIYTDPREKFVAPALFLGLAVMYNAFLAIINAHVMHISQSTVMATEGIIMLGAVGYLLTKLRYLMNCQPIFLFQLVMLVIFLGVTILSEYLNIKAFRDTFLITVFTLLGTLIGTRNLVITFRIITIIVLGFMLLEANLTSIYAAIFNPAKYYTNTRGIEEFSVDDSGLFRNALGFKDRFSFGIFHTHRLSSIFIEQVAMANFTLVLAAYLSLMWNKLRKLDRSVIFLTTLGILLTNNSRTASAVCAVILIGHFIFPRLKALNILYPVIILISVFIFFYDPSYGDSLQGDDLQGRLGYTTKLLSTLKIETLLGMTSRDATQIWDSGYAYLINSQSILGVLVLWMFTSTITLAYYPSALRFSHSLTLIIFVNLLIGMAIFSIKTAAPLWLLTGYVYAENRKQYYET